MTTIRLKGPMFVTISILTFMINLLLIKTEWPRDKSNSVLIVNVFKTFWKSFNICLNHRSKKTMTGSQRKLRKRKKRHPTL